MKSKRPQTNDGIKVRLIKVRLHSKFMIGIIILECLLMSAIILVVEHRMRESILEEFLKRGLSVAKNLAAVNTNYLATYNYVNIEQSVKRITENNGLIYAIVLLFDGEVAAYSGHTNIKKGVLHNYINERALKSNEVLVQYEKLESPEGEICDISVPILLKGEKWGTVRVGLSLKDMHAAILKTRTVLFALGLVALIISCLCSLLLARRITRPIGALVESVEAISNGEYERQIKISTNDEIGYLGNRFAAMQETLKENIHMLTDTNRELTNTNQRLKSLFQVSQAMNSLQNQEKLYDLILEASLTATGALGGSLTLLDRDNNARIVATASTKDSEALQQNDNNLFEGQTAHLYQSSLVDPGIRPYFLHLENGKQDLPSFTIRIDSNPDLELLSIPLQQSGLVLGLINLIRKRKNGTADASESQTLSVLASHATASLENRDLFVQLEDAYLSSIKSLAKSLEFKDEYTHGHAERVAQVCMKIGGRMDMNEKSLKILHNAALLHDLGKIGIMDSILNKNSRLNEEEWNKIKWHPVFSEEILRPIISLREECQIVRHHHEREDGQGYPDGLYGKRLSLSEKIIIVADAYEAMISDRPYRPTLDPAAIRQELQTNKGTQFDSEVVDVFLEIEREVRPQLSNIGSHKIIQFQGGTHGVRNK
ncbi:MAG: HD domain-containing protein [Deltaproteobacteria bacterium]|nr:HD domain-containing protein [Deltaproteobacteria bacterium]